MKIKLVAPHPKIKPHHVKHTAAGLTLTGGALEIFAPFPHVGTVLLMIAGCVAIYEPHIVHEAVLKLEEE